MNHAKPAGRDRMWIAVAVGLTGLGSYGTVRWYRHRTASGTLVAPASIAQPSSDEARALSTTLLGNIEKARWDLDIEALETLEDALMQSIDGPMAESAKIALAESISTRALEATIRARSIDPAASPSAAESIGKVRTLVAGLESRGLFPKRTEAVRTRLRLMAGDDVLSERPEILMAGYRDVELRLAALSNTVWTVDEKPTKAALDQLVTVLRQTSADTGLAHGLLALSHLQRGDVGAAAAQTQTLLQRVPNQPLALAVQRALRTQKPSDAKDPARPAIAADTPAPVPVTTTTTKVAAAAKPPVRRPRPRTKTTAPRVVPDLSVEALASRGCRQVNTGNAKDGYQTLTRAFDRDPRNTVVIICMAEAHAKLGRDDSARALCERVLRQSPRHRRALELAAQLAEHRGDRTTAQKLYKRLLAVDPNHSKARRSLESTQG